MNDSFATRLMQLRRKQHLSQEMLAKELQVTRGCVTNWERGKRQPRPSQLFELSEYFHVTIDYLLGRDTAEDFHETNAQITFYNTLDISMFDAESKIAILEYYRFLKSKQSLE